MGTTRSRLEGPANRNCFFCGKNVQDGVVWDGFHEKEGPSYMHLHEPCVVEFTMHLMKDRHQLLGELRTNAPYQDWGGDDRPAKKK